MAKEQKNIVENLEKKISKVQENIDSRGEIIRKLIQDGLKEIELRDELIKLKEKMQENKPS
ncbi:hypothetical protein [Staphylococcus sp. GDY8P131P]|uniref:hypothetical protein n=1 Tax=Staphylococcus sp. GDY8P131P TaxID=2804159 RepID=UPI001AEC4631|nr:hypothetical protein [Staphylococcus sp. GDY8P131P]